MSTPEVRLRIGVVGAGKVGAVLAARLQHAGHTIIAASGESDASHERAAALLPGVPLDKPSAVARACDVLLLTVPDDMLANVTRVLADSGSLHEGQYVVHTSGRHGLKVLAPAVAVGARAIALHPAMTFSGTRKDLDRLNGCVFGLTSDPDERAFAEHLVADLGGRPTWVPEEMRTLYHAGLAHGANHLVTLVSEAMGLLSAAGVADPGGTLRPLLQAALDNTLEHGDAALTGPIVRGDVRTVAAHLEDIAVNAPDTLPTYVSLARATLDRAVTDGRVLPIRAASIAALLDGAEAGSGLDTPARSSRAARPASEGSGGLDASARPAGEGR